MVEIRRERINFGFDFCGKEYCGLCFRDVVYDDTKDKEYFEWLDAEYKAFEAFTKYRKEHAELKRKEIEPIKTDGDMDFLTILMGAVDIEKKRVR